MPKKKVILALCKKFSLGTIDPLASISAKTGILLGGILLGLSVSFLAGRLVTLKQISPTGIQLINDVSEEVPIVHIFGIQDGRLRGTLDGEVRLFVQEDQVLAGEDGSFDIPAADFFINYVTVKVPEGMHFVASKRGTKFYSVTSAAGANITPANRVYFSTAEEALMAGYRQ